MSPPARILDGRATALRIRGEIQSEVRVLAEAGIQPGLAVLLVGDDPASQVYVRNKDRAAADAGFRVETWRLGARVSEDELLGRVAALNADPLVHGILVQLPLPDGLNAAEVVRAIDPRKDVDGLHPENVAALVAGGQGLRPCTPLGCLELCDRYEILLEGMRVVVIGRSLLVGKPMALLALERNATVTIAHSKTRDLADVVRTADLLVAAAGRPGLVRGPWLRPGAVVIDVGIHRVEGGGLTGDVAFEEAVQTAGAITPVPGGVGPMTVAMLLRNTLLAAERLSGVQGGASRQSLGRSFAAGPKEGA